MDPKVEIKASELAELVRENERLRARVDELLADNTRTVEARRAACLGNNVRDFFRLAAQPIGARPHVAQDDSMRFALGLVVEEAVHELFAAVFGPSEALDALVQSLRDFVRDQPTEAAWLPCIIDAIADAKYVLEGVAVRCGVDMRPIEAAVHAANMAKRGGPKVNGKQLKPEGWRPPNVHGLLLAQGWEGPACASPK